MPTTTAAAATLQLPPLPFQQLRVAQMPPCVVGHLAPAETAALLLFCCCCCVAVFTGMRASCRVLPAVPQSRTRPVTDLMTRSTAQEVAAFAADPGNDAIYKAMINEWT
jgi:hypothetical protein